MSGCPINLLAVLLFCCCTTNWPWKGLFDDRYPQSSQGGHLNQATGSWIKKLECWEDQIWSLQSMAVRPKKGKVVEPTGATGTITVLHTENLSRFVLLEIRDLQLFKKSAQLCEGWAAGTRMCCMHLYIEIQKYTGTNIFLKLNPQENQWSVGVPGNHVIFSTMAWNTEEH